MGAAWIGERTTALGSKRVFHYINDDCIACDACRRECPLDAIRPGPKKYVINESMCVDCGSCLQVCPTLAIVSRARGEEEIELGWATTSAVERLELQA